MQLLSDAALCVEPRSCKGNAAGPCRMRRLVAWCSPFCTHTVAPNLQDPEGFEANGGWSFLDQEAGDSEEEEGDSEEGDAEFRVGSDDDEDGASLTVSPAAS